MPHRFATVGTLSLLLFAQGCQQTELISRTEGRAADAFAAGDFEQATIDYARIVERRPYSARANYNLGRALLRSDRASEAVEHFAVSTELERSSAVYRAAYAEAMYQAGRHAELRSELTRISHELGSADAFLLAGRYSARLGFPDEAAAAYRAAADLGSAEQMDALLAIASLYADLGDRNEALNTLRRAVRLDPSDRRVLEMVRDLGETPGPSFMAVEPG